MKLKKYATPIVFIVLALSTGAAHSESLEGTTFVVTNLFQGDATDQKEVDVSSFGLTNNIFNTVENGIELPGFIDLYDIDVGHDTISFNWVETKFSKDVGGPVPDDKHDRNYFIFDLPTGTAIKSVMLDETASELLDGSALPTATLLAPNRFVTEFEAGVIRSKGFKPQYKIEFVKTE